MDDGVGSATFIATIVGAAVGALCLMAVCFLIARCCYQRKRRKSDKECPAMASYSTLKTASELQENNHKTDPSLNLIENELYEVTNNSPTSKTPDMIYLSDPSANVYECVK